MSPACHGGSPPPAPWDPLVCCSLLCCPWLPPSTERGCCKHAGVGAPGEGTWQPHPVKPRGVVPYRHCGSGSVPHGLGLPYTPPRHHHAVPTAPLSAEARLMVLPLTLGSRVEPMSGSQAAPCLNRGDQCSERCDLSLSQVRHTYPGRGLGCGLCWPRSSTKTSSCPVQAASWRRSQLG